MNEEQRTYIEETVHQQYYDYDTNCAGTSIICLSHHFDFEIGEQAFSASLGMHGAGGYRAQCGLVEGPLMFMGMYFTALSFNRDQIISICRGFAEAFEEKFGSLQCRVLRPQGFEEGQPPHMCEKLTVSAIKFAYEYIEIQQPIEN